VAVDGPAYAGDGVMFRSAYDIRMDALDQLARERREAAERAARRERARGTCAHCDREGVTLGRHGICRCCWADVYGEVEHRCDDCRDGF
jgi:hypothetical protein